MTDQEIALETIKNLDSLIRVVTEMSKSILHLSVQVCQISEKVASIESKHIAGD